MAKQINGPITSTELANAAKRTRQPYQYPQNPPKPPPPSVPTKVPAK